MLTISLFGVLLSRSANKKCQCVLEWVSACSRDFLDHLNNSKKCESLDTDECFRALGSIAIAPSWVSSAQGEVAVRSHR